MSWTEQLFRYCERGADPAFWAEPLNALTNLCFWVAAFAAWRLHQKSKSDLKAVNALLITLVCVIAVGSFLFHTTAMRWASIADLAPIGIFMLAYLVVALRHFLKLGVQETAVCFAVFVLALYGAAKITCAPSFMPVSNALGLSCFNGTLGYVPAWLAMGQIGIVLWGRQHPAWPYLIGAAAVFLISMAFRAFDFELCNALHAFEHKTGTHFLWHTLNAIVLYLLLRAAILHANRDAIAS